MNEKDEKLQERAIKSDSKVIGWLDNFWYHYKWTTIIVLFFAIVILVCTLQICNKENYDITIVYAGSYSVEQEDSASIKKVMNSIMPNDCDGDGEKNTNLLTYYILNQKEIEDIEAKSSNYVDRSYISSQNQNFFTYVQTEASICFVAPDIYKELKDADRLVNVNELLGQGVKGCEDGYGIVLGETDLYEEYGVFKRLPADTVICMINKQISKKQSDFDKEKEMFAAIAAYSRDKAE